MNNKIVNSSKSKKVVIAEIAMEWYQIMIRDNLLINEFIEMFDIREIPFKEKKASFRYYMNIFKEMKPELYKCYVCQYQEMVNSKMDIIKQILKAIICGLSYGICDNDGIRAFDIIDYYIMLNGYPDDLIHTVLLNSFNSDEVRLVSSWYGLRKNNDDNDLCNVDYDQEYANKFMNTNYIYICTNDILGRMIEGGIARSLSIEEKRNIICFLKNKGVPIYPSTIDAAIRRFYSLKKEKVPVIKTRQKKIFN